MEKCIEKTFSLVSHKIFFLPSHMKVRNITKQKFYLYIYNLYMQHPFADESWKEGKKKETTKTIIKRNTVTSVSLYSDCNVQPALFSSSSRVFSLFH